MGRSVARENRGVVSGEYRESCSCVGYGPRENVGTSPRERCNNMPTKGASSSVTPVIKANAIPSPHSSHVTARGPVVAVCRRHVLQQVGNGGDRLAGNWQRRF